ncbi:hypothetical protein KDW_33750 [Dictyobacter vulcani]|uniref:Response regulatory domain-containing protein n=1 Tax=Dictyobacter vulcani TaxID=2607529 RepID=A0A5J4KNC0_9CHLR|nr:response regulator [Dictyobacter vulcani]GER89213.1 hypothetical protein KDW_33750 [Dictyobacter vulcani]
MSDVWRVIVVASDDTLNQNLVNSLHKDGYVVQGVLSGADAVRVLWSEECDVLICDVKTPGTDSLELLQWLRAYRPGIRMIMLGEANSEAFRAQALESGAVSYLEKPLDIRSLKEELRCLLQQTGFSASLDSFDLLDVIQIINMSRKSIMLLVNTGLEERGTLRFQNGDLIWAEYGVLRGEEAFFALAAHKNGTVIQQPWNEQAVSNMTQPLSRLIFQALQYRTKYANQQQYSGEIESVSAPTSSGLDEVDDRPFTFADEPGSSSPTFHTTEDHLDSVLTEVTESPMDKEWWERTGQMPRVENAEPNTPDNDASVAPTVAMNGNELMSLLRKMGNQGQPLQAAPDPVQQTPRVDLPGWLTNQATSSQHALQTSPAASPAPEEHTIPATPDVRTGSGEWPTSAPTPLTTTELLASEQVGSGSNPQLQQIEFLQSSGLDWNEGARATPALNPRRTTQLSGPLYSVQQPPVQQDVPGEAPEREQTLDSNPQLASGVIRAQQAARRNYASLISSLQTLGYSVAGFIAAAVVTIEGQPIAQVAIDDTDISKLCRYFSTIQKSILLTAFEEKPWGDYEDTVITSAERQIFMRMLGSEKKAFQVLITTREANAVECTTLMANVAETITMALQ